MKTFQQLMFEARKVEPIDGEPTIGMEALREMQLYYAKQETVFQRYVEAAEYGLFVANAAMPTTCEVAEKVRDDLREILAELPS